MLGLLKTGRTHQIRVHLKFLGNFLFSRSLSYLKHSGYPIANDPIYGPGSLPFDFVPNTTQLYDENGELEEDQPVIDIGRSGPTTDNQTELNKKIFGIQANDGYDEICDVCNGRRSLSQFALCIWLHALKYESKDWKFEAPMPEWAEMTTQPVL